MTETRQGTWNGASAARSEASPLLLAALLGGGQHASEAWESWRRSIQIQHLSWPDMQILPLLNGPKLEQWLAGDPDAGLLRGIVRRAWSEAQVRLGLARETVLALNRAGCDPVIVTGAAGTYLRSLESTAIRPVLELRLLIPRRHLPIAAAALESEGWHPRDRVPAGDWLDRMSHLFYERGGTRLCLHWRALEVAPRLAAGCEREFLSSHRTVEAIGTRFRILAPGNALLEALSDIPDSVDALSWRAEAALVLRALGPDGAIDWRRWRATAARFQPQVFDRVLALAAMGLDVPKLRQPAAGARLLLPLRQIVETAAQTARGVFKRTAAGEGKA